MNTYTDTGGDNFDEEELVGVLNEIETILDNVDFDDILWNGDLNYDPSRSSGFVNMISRFLNRLGLVRVWDHFPIDYTHIHTDFKSTSTLDHFVCNPRLINCITDCGVLHLGDNPSRHSPIMLKLNVGTIPIKTNLKEKVAIKPAWYKADQMDRDNFTMDLQDRLSSLVTPHSLECSDSQCLDKVHSEERDSHVLDILTATIESSHLCIPLAGGGRVKLDPSKSCHVTQSVPGWKEQVDPYKKDSLFWHAMWTSAGSPRVGGLFEIMKKARNVYHYAVRKVKKEAELIRAKKLFEAAETGSVDLLLEMKKIRGSKKMKHDLLDDVDGVNGELNIVEKFCEVYEQLYNSSGSNEALEEMKAQT